MTPRDRILVWSIAAIVFMIICVISANIASVVIARAGTPPWITTFGVLLTLSLLFNIIATHLTPRG